MQVEKIALIFLLSFVSFCSFSQIDLVTDEEFLANQQKARVSYINYLTAIQKFMDMRNIAMQQNGGFPDFLWNKQYLTDSIGKFHDLEQSRKILLDCQGKKASAVKSSFNEKKLDSLNTQVLGRWSQPWDTSIFISYKYQRGDYEKTRFDYNKRFIQHSKYNDSLLNCFTIAYGGYNAAIYETLIPEAVNFQNEQLKLITASLNGLEKEVKKLRKINDCEFDPMIQPELQNSNEFLFKPIENDPPVPEKQTEEPVILDVVEIAAEYPGGKEALDLFLKKNLKVPDIFMESEVKDKCYVRFIVSETGNISNVKLMKGIADCPECDAEALRVVKMMPDWTPAKNGGNNVNCWYTMPIVFVGD